MLSNLDKEYIRSCYKGNKIGAIRYVREETGADLKEAKEFVEEIFNDEYNKKVSPYTVTNPQNICTKNYSQNSIDTELKYTQEEEIRRKQNSNNYTSRQSRYEALENNLSNTNSINKCLNFLWKIIKFIGRIIVALLGSVMSSVIWGIYLFISIGLLCVFIEIVLFAANIFLNIGNYYNLILVLSIYGYLLFVVIAAIYSFVSILMKKNPLKIPENTFKQILYEIQQRQEEQREFDKKMKMYENYRKHHRRNR